MKFLILFGVLFCSNLFGQTMMKIGDITVSEDRAIEYFNFCQKNPVKVWVECVSSITIGEPWCQDSNGMLYYNYNLKYKKRGYKGTSGHSGFFLEDRKITASDFAKWLIRQRKNKK